MLITCFLWGMDDQWIFLFHHFSLSSLYGIIFSSLFFRTFSSFLIFYSFKTICLGIGFLWHFFFLVFSELFGSAVWCLTLICGKFSVIIQIFHYFHSPFLLLLVFSICMYHAFCSFSTVSRCSVPFLQSFFSLHFSFNDSIVISSSSNSFLSCV